MAGTNISIDYDDYRSTAEKDVAVMIETHRKLGQLLEDPQLGILTWFQAVGECLQTFKDIHDGTYKHV